MVTPVHLVLQGTAALTVPMHLHIVNKGVQLLLFFLNYNKYDSDLFTRIHDTSVTISRTMCCFSVKPGSVLDWKKKNRIYKHAQKQCYRTLEVYFQVRTWRSRHHTWNAACVIQSYNILQLLTSNRIKPCPKSMSNTQSVCFICTSVILSYKASHDKMKTSDTVPINRKWKIRDLGSTAACPGPVLGAAPSSRRNRCTRDTPKQRKRCPRSTALERNVPPAHWGGSTYKTQTHHRVTKKKILLRIVLVFQAVFCANIRRLVAFRPLLDELSFWVDSKQSGLRHADLLIGKCILRN